MTGEDIKEGLRQLGLGRGDAVEVHGSLRSFSTEAGGAPAVEDALESKGLIKEHSIGRARCMIFKAKAVISIYEELLRGDPFALFGVEDV